MKTLSITMTRVVDLLNQSKLPGGNETYLELLFAECAVSYDYLFEVFKQVANEKYSGKQRCGMLEALFVHMHADPEVISAFFEINARWSGPGCSFAESYTFAPTLLALLGASIWGRQAHPKEWHEFDFRAPGLVGLWIAAALQSTIYPADLGMDAWAKGELANRLGSFFGKRYSPTGEHKRRERVLLSIVEDAWGKRSRMGDGNPGSNSPSAASLEVLSQVFHALFGQMSTDEQLDTLLARTRT